MPPVFPEGPNVWNSIEHGEKNKKMAETHKDRKPGTCLSWLSLLPH